MNYILKNKHLKKVLIIAGISLGILLITLILWLLVFSKYFIFYNQEKKFTQAVEKYYEYRPELLPPVGEVREITLAKMFKENRMEGLYIPKTNKLCDEGWVRVYHKENGKYDYITYLKCGSYRSRTDSRGPEIKLKGDSTMIINSGSNFKDPGIESVTDNRDGKIDTKKVVVDTSKIKINTPGNYEVTYKVNDKTFNQTIVVREVIVTNNLTEEALVKVDSNRYFSGSINNNYVQYSGMLWQMIKVNEDGSIKLISNDYLANIRSDYIDYQGSNIEAWLTKYFYPNLLKTDDYLIEDEYCVGNVSSKTDTLAACSKKIKASVGLLSLTDYLKTFNNNQSYLCQGASYSLGNKINGDLLIATTFESNCLHNMEDSRLPSIRAVITLKDNLPIIMGTGSKEDPYKLNDYKYATEHTEIKNLVIGEVINYSGYNLRIIDKEDDNVKVVMAQPLINNTTRLNMPVNVYGIEDYYFDVDTKGNPGYIVNNDYLDYFDESNIVRHTYQIPLNVPNMIYSKYDTYKTFKAKLSLATSFDLFSGIDDNDLSTTTTFLYLDKLSNKDNILILNGHNGLGMELFGDSFPDNKIKLVFYLKGNLEVKEGRGTITSPYYLR